jgi:hypothetical protein
LKYRLLSSPAAHGDSYGFSISLYLIENEPRVYNALTKIFHGTYYYYNKVPLLAQFTSVALVFSSHARASRGSPYVEKPLAKSDEIAALFSITHLLFPSLHLDRSRCPAVRLLRKRRKTSTAATKESIIGIDLLTFISHLPQK